MCNYLFTIFEDGKIILGGLPMTCIEMFHQWFEEYSKRHEYSKANYVAQKTAKTHNPSPSSIHINTAFVNITFTF